MYAPLRICNFVTVFRKLLCGFGEKTWLYSNVKRFCVVRKLAICAVILGDYRIEIVVGAVSVIKANNALINVSKLDNVIDVRVVGILGVLVQLGQNFLSKLKTLFG